METKICDQLMNAIWDKETEINTDYYRETRRVRKIIINLDIFKELADEINIENSLASEYVPLFLGIPLIRTQDVETWELREG